MGPARPWKALGRREGKRAMRQPAILVADHEEGPRRDLTGWFRSQGFVVIESSDEADALRALQAAQPDLVIVGSPRGGAWTGLELARQIRRTDGRVPPS